MIPILLCYKSIVENPLSGHSVKAKEASGSYSDFVFSPPRTQLRDRSFIPSTVSEIETVGVEESKERKTEKSARNKTGKTMTKIKATKDKTTPKLETCSSLYSFLSNIFFPTLDTRCAAVNPICMYLR